MKEYTLSDMKFDAATEDNDMLLRRLIRLVGYDYVAHEKKDTAQIHPDFSEETKVFWEEVEHRLNAPTVLAFDRERCRKEINKDIEDQNWHLKHGQDYTHSYHAGIKNGLYKALGIMEKYLSTVKDVTKHGQTEQ